MYDITPFLLLFFGCGYWQTKIRHWMNRQKELPLEVELVKKLWNDFYIDYFFVPHAHKHYYWHLHVRMFRSIFYVKWRLTEMNFSISYWIGGFMWISVMVAGCFLDQWHAYVWMMISSCLVVLCLGTLEYQVFGLISG